MNIESLSGAGYRTHLSSWVLTKKMESPLAIQKPLAATIPWFVFAPLVLVRSTLGVSAEGRLSCLRALAHVLGSRSIACVLHGSLTAFHVSTCATGSIVDLELHACIFLPPCTQQVLSCSRTFVEFCSLNGVVCLRGRYPDPCLSFQRITHKHMCT